MKLFIDGKEVTYEFESSLTLQEVLKVVYEQIYIAHRVVADLQINGQSFRGTDKDLQSVVVGDTEALNILTSSLKDVIVASLDGATSHLPQLITGIERSAELLRDEEIAEGMNMLRQSITGLSGFIEIVDKSTQLVAATLAPSLMEELSIIERRVAINEVLNEVVSKLREEDFLTVSDLLENELTPVMKEWVIFLPQVARRINIGLN